MDETLISIMRGRGGSKGNTWAPSNGFCCPVQVNGHYCHTETMGQSIKVRDEQILQSPLLPPCFMGVNFCFMEDLMPYELKTLCWAFLQVFKCYTKIKAVDTPDSVLV